MSCPACIAEGKSGGIPRQWYHGGGCGGRLEVGNNAYYRCTKCGYNSHVRGWSYSCDGHGDYRMVSDSHLASAVSVASQLTISSRGKMWLLELLNNMGYF